MKPRPPAVAGQFYPADKIQCIAEIEEFLQDTPENTSAPIAAGIVPHAGWVFSGQLAAQVFAAIKQADQTVDTFILFGAVHRFYGNFAAVYDNSAWQTPLGDIPIDTDLTAEITNLKDAISDCPAHEYEHSIEVQVPLIQYLFPAAKIVPIMTTPGQYAIDLGADIANIAANSDKRIVAIGSTDLTHYGPQYGFTPKGSSDAGLQWAKDVNDMTFITPALDVEPEETLIAAMENDSACGPGSAAALIAYAKKTGKQTGQLLAHTHSNEIMQKKFHQKSQESVGYAAIVY